MQPLGKDFKTKNKIEREQNTSMEKENIDTILSAFDVVMSL